MQINLKKLIYIAASVIFSAFVSVTGFFCHMLLKHDKDIALIDYKVTIVLQKIAPEMVDQVPPDLAKKK